MPRTTERRLRFQPPPAVAPGRCPEEYACPSCARSISRVRLAEDINGVPRAVDLSGIPCQDCLSHFGAVYLDDGK